MTEFLKNPVFLQDLPLVLSLRNAWVRGSNPLCGTIYQKVLATFLGVEDSMLPIRTPDRQKAG